MAKESYILIKVPVTRYVLLMKIIFSHVFAYGSVD